MNRNKISKNKKLHIGYSVLFSSAAVLGIIITTVLVFLVMWYFSVDNSIRLQDVSVLTLIILTFILGSIITFALRKAFISPLIKLTDAMNMVAEGDFTIQLDNRSQQPDLTEMYSSFNTMVKELAKTDTLQTDFISNVSHEFKTPINAIEGYASLLQDTTLSEAERNIYVEKIIFNTRRLSELVGNVLLLSKISNQSVQPKLSTYRLDEQIRQAILALESKWEKKDIDFDIELADIDYTGTENLMAHVWTNLIDNAVKFSPTGGRITIRLFKKTPLIQFVIKNEVPQIPPESIDNIFNKFYQCDTSRKSEGNGLGLTLAKNIVDIANGYICVKSNLEEGTVFEVFLPDQI